MADEPKEEPKGKKNWKKLRNVVVPYEEPINDDEDDDEEDDPIDPIPGPLFRNKSRPSTETTDPPPKVDSEGKGGLKWRDIEGGKLEDHHNLKEWPKPKGICNPFEICYVFAILYSLFAIAQITLFAVILHKTGGPPPSEAHYSGASLAIISSALGLIVVIAFFLTLKWRKYNEKKLFSFYLGIIYIIILLICFLMSWFSAAIYMDSYADIHDMEEFSKGYFLKNKRPPPMLDYFQKEFRCCGIFGPLSTYKSTFQNITINGNVDTCFSVPDSCCNVKKEKCGEKLIISNFQINFSSIAPLGCGAKLQLLKSFLEVTVKAFPDYKIYDPYLITIDQAESFWVVIGIIQFIVCMATFFTPFVILLVGTGWYGEPNKWTEMVFPKYRIPVSRKGSKDSSLAASEGNLSHQSENENPKSILKKNRRNSLHSSEEDKVSKSSRKSFMDNLFGRRRSSIVKPAPG